MQKVAIVTGSSTGIGFRTASALARKGYQVIVATRNAAAGAAAAARINAELAARAPSFLDGDGAGGGALFMPLDTGSLASVGAFADAFLSRAAGAGGGGAPALHALVLNAGVASRAPGEARLTGDGHERVFAVNFLGHFALTARLLDALKLTAAAAPVGGPPVRVVTLGSVTHRLVRAAPPWGDVIAGRAPRGSSPYALSKLAALAFAFELQHRLVGTGVAAIAVNPGAVASDIWRHVPPRAAVALRAVMGCAFLTPAQGSATSVAAATAAELPGAPSLAAPAPVYLSPYRAPAWAAAAGGWAALAAGDLIGRPTLSPPHAQAPTPLALDRRVGGALWDACEAALMRAAGL